MTSAIAAKPKVFFSYPQVDRELARRVASVLEASGLEVFDAPSPRGGVDPGEQIRLAMEESSAAVVVLSQADQGQCIPASVLFEIGAAMGAGKPIYVLVTEPSQRLSFNVPGMVVLPSNHAEEIACRLRAA